MRLTRNSRTAMPLVEGWRSSPSPGSALAAPMTVPVELVLSPSPLPG